ncbi:MAG TPA: extracellular solute-binding protein [Clostridia bacterium]|nr:extracellular solute-binding protein [Clostridia bacterium]
MGKKLIITISVVLIVIIAGGIAAFMLLGNKNSEEDEFLPTANDFEADVENLKSEKLTLCFYGQETPSSAEVLQAVNNRLKQEINAEIQFKFIFDRPENYLEKIKSDISAGLPCDAFYNFGVLPADLETLANEGYIADLTELFPKNAPNYYRQFSKDDIDAASINGKLYAVPERVPHASRTCAIVRQDLLEKYGIPEIKSYYDYEFYLRTIKEKEPGLIPMNCFDTMLGLFADAYGYVILDDELGLVYKWDDPNVKIQAWEQTPVFEECLNRIKSWRDMGYLTKNIGVAQLSVNMIASKKWASFVGMLGEQFNLTALNYKAYQLNDGYSVRLNPLRRGMAINAKSANAERVFMFIDWLESSQENYDLYMYGVKGKHYIEKEDYIEPPEDAVEGDYFYYWFWTPPFRNIGYERSNAPGMKEEMVQYYDIIREKSKYPPLNGFTPDYSTVDSIMNARKLSYADMDRSVYTGDYDESKVNAYIKSQKDAGIDNLITEVQRQADQFRAGQ